mmetsp:Transcript_3683/g.5333  ORF Transcript_3683/g.5333 Transcript_3683/m.5333 type:complete len:98 (-) Transcript_3683:867-1160(-)
MCCVLHINPSMIPNPTMIHMGMKTIERFGEPYASRKYSKISNAKSEKDMAPVFKPNFNALCSSGKYSVRSIWSVESGLCLLLFASWMKLNKDFAEYM